jgi:hypothetical protein
MRSTAFKGPVWPEGITALNRPRVFGPLRRGVGLQESTDLSRAERIPMQRFTTLGRFPRIRLVKQLEGVQLFQTEQCAFESPLNIGVERRPDRCSLTLEKRASAVGESLAAGASRKRAPAMGVEIANVKIDCFIFWESQMGDFLCPCRRSTITTTIRAWRIGSIQSCSSNCLST